METPDAPTRSRTGRDPKVVSAPAFDAREPTRTNDAAVSTRDRDTSLRVILASALFRWACFALMTVMAVWNEGRPGVQIADPFLDLFPYSPWVAHWNYTLWVCGWFPFLIALLILDRRRFVVTMFAGGVLSLLRGVCIVITGLGPVDRLDHNAALAWDWELRGRVVLRILDFFAVFTEHTANVWLTKDLFFSGHTASTFLIVLACWPYRPLRYLAIATHTLIVASLFFGKIHYTIDVLGAYAFTALVWRFGAVRWLRRGIPRPDSP